MQNTSFVSNFVNYWWVWESSFNICNLLVWHFIWLFFKVHLWKTCYWWRGRLYEYCGSGRPDHSFLNTAPLGKLPPQFFPRKEMATTPHIQHCHTKQHWSTSARSLRPPPLVHMTQKWACLQARFCVIRLMHAGKSRLLIFLIAVWSWTLS